MMKKKILSEGLLIFLIMIIGIFSSIPTVNAESKASLSASEGIDSQKEKTVTVTLNIPSGAIGAQADITIKYSDNTTDSKKIAFVTGLGGNTVTFSAKGKNGTATITASNIRISDANSESLETNGSTSTSVTLTKPDNSNDNNSNNNNNNNNSSSDNNNSDNGNNGNNSTTSTEPAFTDVNEAVFTNDRVNLRKSYSTSSAKIITLDKNTKLTRTGVSSSGWSRVTYNGQTGYIYTQYLTKNETTTEKPEEKEVKITDVNETMYANQDCNLRKSWTTSSDKVGYLTKGQEITRTGVTNNGWSRIKYNGKDVFVLSSLITKEKPEENEEEPDEPEIEDTENEATEEEKTELEILQEEIGVLPEVGNNISTTIYIITTIVSSLGVLIGLYYINKKDVK